jgi:hypothetical protein
MSKIVKHLTETFSLKTRSGYAFPQQATVYETPSISLSEVMSLYQRDPTCKASVDLLAASAVGSGFYTTVNADYEKAKEAKQAIDAFNEAVNLDALLCDMARTLIACGNDFWLKLTPEKLVDLHRLPVDAVERIEQSYIGEKTSSLKIPYKVESYKLKQTYGGESLNAEAVVHWRINCLDLSGYGTAPSGNGVTVKAWNNESFAWENAQSGGAGGSDEIIAVNLSQNLPCYIDEDGYVWFLARTTNPSNGVTPAVLHCDYVCCTVTVNGIMYCDIASYRDVDRVDVKPFIFRTEFTVKSWFFENIGV